MIYTPVTKALETHLAAMSGVPAIARQNVKYEPTTGTPFVRSENIPTLRRRTSVGPTPWQRYEGLYRVTACTSEGVGVGANFTLMDDILEQFDSATDLYYDTGLDVLYTQSEYELLQQNNETLILDRTVYVTIDYSEPGSPYIDSPWYCTPVNIHYYAYWRNS